MKRTALLTTLATLICLATIPTASAQSLPAAMAHPKSFSMADLPFQLDFENGPANFNFPELTVQSGQEVAEDTFFIPAASLPFETAPEYAGTPAITAAALKKQGSPAAMLGTLGLVCLVRRRR